MKKILLLTTVLVLLIPATANASWLSRSLAIAESYWAERGFSDCTGLDIEVRWHKGMIEDRYMGKALVGFCNLEHRCDNGANCYPNQDATDAYMTLSDVARGRSFRYNCRLVVHEYGHLVGLGHDPAYPIMAERLYHIPQECQTERRHSARFARVSRNDNRFTGGAR